MHICTCLVGCQFFHHFYARLTSKYWSVVKWQNYKITSKQTRYESSRKMKELCKNLISQYFMLQCTVRKRLYFMQRKLIDNIEKEMPLFYNFSLFIYCAILRKHHVLYYVHGSVVDKNIVVDISWKWNSSTERSNHEKSDVMTFDRGCHHEAGNGDILWSEKRGEKWMC